MWHSDFCFVTHALRSPVESELLPRLLKFSQYPIYSFPQRTPPNEPALNPEVLPRVLRRVDPEYTPEARKARIAGIVVVEVIVERDGRVGAARVLKPLPFGLSQKAVEAVRQWRFSPATHEGKPIRAFFTVTVDFRPEDE
ncbi:MAG: hypothetical protein DMF58_20040 [Acidobacteria bacterium]|nr:MAG: hypothetical protein DMF58_20040 [Acidobacteriota bacterium]